MNLCVRAVGDGADSAEMVAAPDALRKCLRRGCAAAIGRRQPPPEVQSWLDGIHGEALPRARVIFPTHAVGEVVRQLFAMANLSVGAECAWLQQDIIGLADILSDLMNARYLRLRLDVVTTNGCRKFHIDVATARLVCTYRGTGTQYGVSSDGDDPRRVFTVQTGAPILMRGTLRPAKPPSGLLHRSPPIEGTGETRFVLVLEPVDDPEDEI